MQNNKKILNTNKNVQFCLFQLGAAQEKRGSTDSSKWKRRNCGELREP